MGRERPREQIQGEEIPPVLQREGQHSHLGLHLAWVLGKGDATLFYRGGGKLKADQKEGIQACKSKVNTAL